MSEEIETTDSKELLKVERSMIRREYIAKHSGLLTFFVLFCIAVGGVATLLTL